MKLPQRLGIIPTVVKHQRIEDDVVWLDESLAEQLESLPDNSASFSANGVQAMSYQEL